VRYIPVSILDSLMRSVAVLGKARRRGATCSVSRRFRRSTTILVPNRTTRMSVHSSSRVENTSHGLISKLSKLSPAVPVRADDVEIILDPNDFYNQLNVRLGVL
jgi:hypothetical protein